MTYTAGQFLGLTNTAVTRAGKQIYVSAIGRNKLKFVSLRPVTWTIYDPKAGTFLNYTEKSGSVTPNITNSYTSKSKGVVMIEFDLNGKTHTAILNKENFDLSPLESLPSVEAENAAAQGKADSANNSELGFMERIIKDLLSSNTALYVAGAAAGYVVLKELFKRK